MIEFNDMSEVDSFWKHQKLDDLEVYKSQVVDPVRVVKVVHPGIHARIENVRRVLFYAYYKYELLDVAYDYLLLTMEAALKARYEELEGNSNQEEQEGSL
ncbi:MAG: hypothetical protein HOL70_04965 [Candidatus Marinimicrobia bacterium]|jgi:hypothetical protein|nr:hypothetical protein [Candidatus Neomarinimicrobiota bacterium]